MQSGRENHSLGSSSKASHPLSGLLSSLLLNFLSNLLSNFLPLGTYFIHTMFEIFFKLPKIEECSSLLMSQRRDSTALSFFKFSYQSC